MHCAARLQNPQFEALPAEYVGESAGAENTLGGWRLRSRRVRRQPSVSSSSERDRAPSADVAARVVPAVKKETIGRARGRCGCAANGSQHGRLTAGGFV